MTSYPVHVQLTFSGEMWWCKGPSPWHSITVPEEDCGRMEAASALVRYGCGLIPVTAQIRESFWNMSFYPKDTQYIVPVKAHVRRADGLDVGDT
jgi:Domain of unknown function (DUF1905)